MDYNQVFSFKNLYNSYLKCCKSVNWKTSTINFRMRAVQNISKIKKQLDNGSFKSKGFYNFIINERGKQRKIRAVHISERIVQKCLCDNYLNPLLTKKLIYDSGATLKNKGFSFTINRLVTHLQKFGRKYTNGYILTFDYSKYFDSIDHDILLAKLNINSL